MADCNDGQQAADRFTKQVRRRILFRLAAKFNATVKREERIASGVTDRS